MLKILDDLIEVYESGCTVIEGTHRLEGSTQLDCEVLIVGSGAGGSTVANVLTEAGIDVLMLEEGPVAGPERNLDRVAEALPRLWRSGGLNAALGKPPISYAEGRCVGGGTEINSGILQRLPEGLLDKWAQKYKIDEFGATELDHYFDWAFDAVNASLINEPLGEPSEILRLGSEKLGWKATKLELAEKQYVGSNGNATRCLTYEKQSMSVSLLPNALERTMRLIAECRVIKLHWKGRRVTQATAIARNAEGQKKKVRVRANHVFVCCGPIHTPLLLRRSHLSTIAGNTLQLHPTIKMTARFPQLVDASSARLPLYAITEYMPDLRFGGSIFTPGFFAMSLAEDWDKRKDWISAHRHCGLYYAMVRGKGMGKIHPVPFATEPVVTYKLTESDWKNLTRGSACLAEVMFAAGAEAVYPSIENHPGWVTSDQAKKETEENLLPKTRTNLMTVHLFSSCSLGEAENLTIVDSFGRLRGYENLYVADASLIPEAPGVNPQATIMALAFRVAEEFLSSGQVSRQRKASREDVQ